MDALREHNEALEGPFKFKADIDRLEAQLVGAAADLETERERADKAIAAFASLADKLDALAAEWAAAVVEEAGQLIPLPLFT